MSRIRFKDTEVAKLVEKLHGSINVSLVMETRA